MPSLQLFLAIAVVGVAPPTSQPASPVEPGNAKTDHGIDIVTPGSDDVIHARLILLDRSAVDDETVTRIVQGVAIIKGVVHVDHDEKNIRLMVDTRAEVTASRVTEFLRLAGYEISEAGPEAYRGAWREMMDRCGAPDDDPIAPVESEDLPKAESLQSSLDPLKEWFNRHANEPRFVAILSPT